jgi:ABC-type transport system substrate-binding protein
MRPRFTETFPTRLTVLLVLSLTGLLAAQCAALTPTVTTPPPTATVENRPVIVVALDSDIGHIELMEFRSDGGYHATANLYEPLVSQQLVPGAEKGVLEGTSEYGPVLAEVTFSDDNLVATVQIREDA